MDLLARHVAAIIAALTLLACGGVRAIEGAGPAADGGALADAPTGDEPPGDGDAAADEGSAPDRIVEVRVGCLGLYCVRTASGRVECPQSYDADAGARTVVDAGAVALSVGGTFVYHDELLACSLLEGSRIVCVDPQHALSFESVLPGATAVSVGYMPPCALRSDGTVACAESTEPTGWAPVAGIAGATAVSVGDAFACALDGAGVVRCWGVLDFDGGRSGSSPPSVIPLAKAAVAIAAGYRGACALDADGFVTCWGGGPGEELVPPDIYPPAIAIAADQGDVCVLTVSHHVVCSVAGSVVNPDLGGAVTQMDVGGHEVCGLTPDGSVVCASLR